MLRRGGYCPAGLRPTADPTTRLLRGVNQLADAVKVIPGPRGGNVVLEEKYGGPTITKDGVTVAKEIELRDSLENMGVPLSHTGAPLAATRGCRSARTKESAPIFWPSSQFGTGALRLRFPITGDGSTADSHVEGADLQRASINATPAFRRFGAARWPGKREARRGE